MLYASMQHGKEDMQARLLAETKIEANRLLIALESGLKEDADLLNTDELEQVNKHKTQLLKSLEGEDREKIAANVIALENASADFAGKRMNKHIASSLRGRAINDV